MGTHLQTHVYRVTRSILRKRISAFGMYSQEEHIKSVFLELDMKGFTYNHACGSDVGTCTMKSRALGKE